MSDERKTSPCPSDVEVSLVAPLEIRPEELELWSQWAAMSPFFHPAFTELVAKQRGDVQVAVYRDANGPLAFFPFHRDRRNFARPIGLRLSDYHGPICRDSTTIEPEAFLRAGRLRGWAFNHLPLATKGFSHAEFSRSLSPFMDLSAGFEAYRDEQRKSGSRLIPQIERKSRKLAREVGPLRFVEREDDSAVLEQLFRWKSAQRKRSRAVDVLDYPWVRELLATLAATKRTGFEGRLSALYAGDRLVAAQLGLCSTSALHYWFPGYDPDYEKYSPGLSLLLTLAKTAAEEGRRRVDLGRGEERYKVSLATGHTPLRAGLLTTNKLRQAAWKGGFKLRRTLRDSKLEGSIRWLRSRASKRSLDGS